MLRFKGVIFDMDGVIVDNHKYHFSAWMEFSKRHKFELNEEIYREHYNGKTNADLFQMIFGKLSEEQIIEYAEEKEGLYQDLYREHMKAHTGLLDFLDYLVGHKVRIALGTSAPTKNVDFILDALKLRQYFSVIVDGSQVDKGKPDPQVYQMCVNKLGLEPKQCVVFEDSLAGLESGERAGCTIIAVATSHKASELKPMTENIIFDFTEAKKFFSANSVA
jgi:beta-phosphoglucomutase